MEKKLSNNALRAIKENDKLYHHPSLTITGLCYRYFISFDGFVVFRKLYFSFFKAPALTSRDPRSSKVAGGLQQILWYNLRNTTKLSKRYDIYVKKLVFYKDLLYAL